MFRTLTRELAINMSETEVRTLSVHKVANPVLQVRKKKRLEIGKLIKINSFCWKCKKMTRKDKRQRMC